MPAEPLPLVSSLPPQPPTLKEVREEIIRQATEAKFNVKLALKIADCESDFRYNAKNPNSSATGVYQFTIGTWKWIGAKGERTDHKENIRNFIKWFPRYPRWWSECLD
jgi:hypothetical protein